MKNTDKDKLLDANKNLEALKKQIEQLEDKIENYEHNENALLQDKEKLYKLYEAGYIDSDGEIKES